MKKIILIIIVSLVGFYGQSQSKKSDLKLTMSVLPLIGSSNDFKGINGVVIKPSVGFFITDKTSIDLNFSYASLNDLKIRGIDSYYNSYAIIPTLRNNFINKQKWRVFAEFGIGLGTIKYDADDSENRTKILSDLSGGISVLNIGLGGNYFFNDKFGVELLIPYINTKNSTSEKFNELYSGIGPTIGFTYKLNK